MKVQADFVQIPRPLNKIDQSSSSSSSSSTNKLNSFSNLRVVSKINDSKFPVFLAFSPIHNKNCALKIFPYKDGKINPAYTNESRFVDLLSHKNVVTMLACTDKQKSTAGSQKFTASCTLMEYAPFGDFADFLLNKQFYKDEKLARTYFRQLIEGIEYLHSQGIVHLDLKLENLLLGEDFKLKIADFDLGYIEGDRSVRGRGTCNYRAPELIIKNCVNVKAADIYSAGILLFTYKSGGFPCLEDSNIEGHNLYDLMLNEDNKFWEVHQKLQKKRVAFDEDFKKLFMSMVKYNPEERATIEEIKSSKWYQGPTYSDEELVGKLASYGIFKIKTD